MKKNKSFFIVPMLLMAMSVSACNLLPNLPSKPSGNDPVESNNPDDSEVKLPEAFKIYQLYLANGGTLTYEQWLESVKGEKGDPGHTPEVSIGENGNWFIDGKDTKIHAQGEKGDKGEKGDTGKTAYEQYKEAHPEYNKSEEEWLDDLLNGRLGTEITHRVQFDSNGGNDITEQTIKHGEKVSKPNDPTRDGFIFEGWMLNDELWSFNGYVVTEDMVLKAKWKAIDYIATFLNDDGSVLETQENVHYGDQLTYHGENPEKPNPEDHYIYTFKGWDKELTVNGDMVFTAQYDKQFAPYEEKYLDAEGNVIYSRFLTEDTSRKIIFNDKKLEEEDGQYYLEAESAIVSDGVSILHDSGHGGGAIGSPNAGRYLKYQFTVSESISAVITAAVSNTYNRFNELFSITVNGNEIEISDDATHPGTHLWEDYQEGIVGKASFKKGLNELIVNFNYDYFNMDYIGLKNCAFDLSQEGVENPTKANEGDYKYQFRDWEKQDQVDNVINYVPIFAKATKGLEFINQKVDVYHGSAKEVLIPEWWDGFAITEIGRGAFGSSEVESVTLPDTITDIGENAFNNAANLVSINFPNSLTGIGTNAFQNCTSLEVANLNEGLKEIWYHAFEGSGLKQVIIPSTVERIHDNAFGGLRAEFIYVPASVTYIEWNAFWSPDDYINTIYCEREYRPSTYDTNWNHISTVVWGYKSMVEENGYKYAICEIEGENCATLVDIDETVVDFELPDKVNDIPVTGMEISFRGNENIKTIVLPDFIKEIKDSMFRECISLTSIVIPDSVTTIGRCAFQNDKRLASVTFGNGITLIKESAFDGCSSLSAIELKEGLTKLENNAFSNCTSIVSVSLPESLTYIGGFCFASCTKLVTINMPAAVQYIGGNAFSRTAITSMIIPNGIEVIYNSVFSEAQSLTYVVIPTSVNKIEDYAFYVDYAFKTVFYMGTQAQWNEIDIHDAEYSHLSNGQLADATINFYSETEPTEEGNFWHYVDGVPTVW